MEITFVLPNLLLYGGVKSTIHMAEAMRQRGHEVTVVYPRLPGRDGQAWWRPRKTLVQVVRFIQSFFTRPDWIEFGGNLRQVPYLAERFLPAADVLVLTWWADVASLHGANPSLGKVVHFVRSYETWGGPKELVEKVYQLDLPRVTNSELLANQLPHPPLRVIHNGLDELFFASAERKDRNSITIGILYRVQNWKRMDDAVEVLSKTVTDYPELRVVVFGEAMKPEHQQILRGLRHFEYVHLPAGEALRAIYARLDIFLFTSDETEAFGNPPLEAMAMGCAVVATKVGAVASYSVNEESALHCAPRDTLQMIALIKRLIADADLREELGSCAQISARRFRWSEQARQFETLLEDLVAPEAANE